jgi:hypothetical protein
LVDEVEAVLLQRPPQLALHLDAAPHLAVQLAAVRLELATPGGLGAVECEIGVPDQALRGFAVGGKDRHADAAGDVDLASVEVKRRLQGRKHARCHRRDALRRLQVLLDQSELVAAEAGPGVACAGDRGQALGDLSQQRIAGKMAKRVVDLLELIEVEQHQRHMLVPAAGTRDR